MMTPERRAELKLMPAAYDFAWPMLRALRDLGGHSGNRTAIEETAFQLMGLSTAQLAVLKPDKKQTEASNRAWWAMTYLRWVRLVRNDDGVWVLTPYARKLMADHPLVDDGHRATATRLLVLGAKRAHEQITIGDVAA